MDEYAGRVLADRYRLPLPPSDEYELTETLAFDTYSGQEVLVRQVPLPEVVEAEVLDAEGLPAGFTARERGARRTPVARTATRRPTDPAVRRAVEAVQAVAGIPDHPRLDQVFDVFAEGGSLWIVSEAVPARPLSALLAEQPLTPYRAAEVASDVLMALRVLHAHGWVHRNVTARTVLVLDDGRIMLTGLAVGAAEEALCGYDPVPVEEGRDDGPALPAPRDAGAFPRSGGPAGGGPVAGGPVAGGPAAGGPAPSADVDPEAARRAAIQARVAGGLPTPDGSGASGGVGGAGGAGPAGPRALESGSGDDVRAARAGAIAAYRAGARAAARVQEAQQNGRAALPGARPPAPGDTDGNGAARQPYAPEQGSTPPGHTPPGTIADPCGVHGRPWHGATPRPASGTTPAPADGAPQRPTTLPPATSGPQPSPGSAPHGAVPPGFAPQPSPGSAPHGTPPPGAAPQPFPGATPHAPTPHGPTPPGPTPPGTVPHAFAPPGALPPGAAPAGSPADSPFARPTSAAPPAGASSARPTSAAPPAGASSAPPPPAVPKEHTSENH
ncbi:protein kinase, partial [Streptomyces sp. NPDC002523]